MNALNNNSTKTLDAPGSTAETVNNRRVLFINRSYWPDNEATGQLLTELCESLAASFKIGVIAGQPNSNVARDEFNSRGEQNRNGVTIRRVSHFRFDKKSMVGRLLNYVSFLLAATKAALFSKKPDIIVIETDPPLLCMLGALARWRHKSKLVVYLQDIHPDVAVALGKIRNGFLARTLRRIFFSIYRRANQVIVLSEDMRQFLIDDAKVLPENIKTIPNWTDVDAVCPVKENNKFRHREEVEDQFVVMYSGNLGLTQALDDVIAAAESLQHRADIIFLLVGNGATRGDLELLVEQKGLTNVRFLDYQPKSELATSLSAADVHLVPLDPRIVKFLMPSKLYGIFASGTPLIAITTEECELAKIVQSEEVGYVVKPGNPDALTNQIEMLADHPGHLVAMGQRARELAVERYDRKHSVGAFQSMLQTQLGSADVQPVSQVEDRQLIGQENLESHVVTTEGESL